MAKINISTDLIKLQRQEAVSRITKAIMKQLYKLHVRNIPAEGHSRHTDWVDLENVATRQAIRITAHIREVMFTEERNMDKWERTGTLTIYFDDGMIIKNQCQTEKVVHGGAPYHTYGDITASLMDIDEDMAVMLLLKYGDKPYEHKGGANST